MRGVIFANGEYGDMDFYREVVRPGDVVVCADGGANVAYELGLTPEAIVGDFDSADPSVVKRFEAAGAHIERRPVEKDETDMELAIDYAISRGVDELVICGALGGRIDQTLANVYLLTRADAAGVSAIILESCAEISIADGESLVKGAAGDEVSIIPMGARAAGITLSGFKYPLVEGELAPEMTLGISNELIGDEGRISVREGRLIVINRGQVKGSVGDGE